MSQNKNEEEQFNVFKSFLKKGQQSTQDLFYNYTEIEQADESYDAVVSFKDHKKYVQITTMTNLPIGKKNKWQDGARHSFIYDAHKNDGDFNKLGVNINLEKNENDFKMNYALPKLLCGETDFDKKHQLHSDGLINAVHRSIIKKLQKYGANQKKDKSVLVIMNLHLDNILYSLFNLRVATKHDFFKLIFLIALQESNFENDSFFDEIQVYFKEWQENPGADFFYPINNKIHYDFPNEQILKECKSIWVVTLNAKEIDTGLL